MMIMQDVDLSHANTLRLPVRCRYYLNVQHADQVPMAIAFAQLHGLSILALSGGSNILLPSYLDALVLHMSNIGQQLLDGKQDNDQDAISIEVQAGENWHDFVCQCTTNGWYGLENLALIPGRVGAAPIQNIGAYGIEVGQFIRHIKAYDVHHGAWVNLSAEQCCFSYRDSIFKQYPGRFIVTSVTFKLSRSPQLCLSYADVAQQVGTSPTPQCVLDTIIQIRQSKLPDPQHFPNVGSFFKNPIVSAERCQTLLSQYPKIPHHLQLNGDYKLAAGWLIEQSGWKGKRLGAVGMFERQALVLVNFDHGTLADVQATYRQVQQDVVQRFGVWLEPEPVLFNLLGQPIKAS